MFCKYDTTFDADYTRDKKLRRQMIQVEIPGEDLIDEPHSAIVQTHQNIYPYLEIL